MSDFQVIPQASIDSLADGQVTPEAFDTVFGAGASQRALGGRSVDPHETTYTDAADTRDLSFVGRVWDNTAGAIVYGAQEAANEVVDSFESFDKFYGETMERLGVPAYLSFTDTPDGSFGIGMKHRSEIIAADENIAFFGKGDVQGDAVEINAKQAPGHWTGQMVAGVSQFATGYAAAARVTKLTGVLGMFANGALADAYAFDPKDTNVVGFVESLGVDAGAFGDLMATDPEDPDWQNRLRNVAEGAAFGAAFELVAHSMRAARLRRDGKAAAAAEADRLAIRAARAVELEIKGAAAEVQDDALKSVEVGKKLKNLKLEVIKPDDARALTPEEIAKTAEAVERVRPHTPAELAAVLKEEEALKSAAPKDIRKGTGFYTEASMKRAEDFLATIRAHRNIRSEGWRKAGRTHEQLRAEAGAALRRWESMTGESADEVLAYVSKEIGDPDEIAHHVVARTTAAGRIADVTNAMSATIHSGTFDPKKWPGFKNMEELEAEYFRLKTTIEPQLFRAESNMRSSVGEAQNAQKIVAKDVKAIEAAKKANPALYKDAKSMAKAQVLAREAGEPVLTAPSRLAKAAKETAEVVNTYRINALLSGPGTQEVNFVSNLVNALAMPTQELIGGAMTLDARMMRHALQTFRGQMMSIPDALDSMLRVWNSKAAELDPYTNKVEDSLNKRMSESTVGNIVQLPTRLLMTMDELFKQSTYRGRVFADADEIARLKGLKGKERKDFLRGYIADSFNETGQATRSEALLQAQRATFTEDLIKGTFAHAVQNMAVKNPMVRFVVPFVRTPVNILSTALQHFPVAGALSKRWKADMAAGGVRRAQALGKQAIGTMLVLGAWQATQTGNITGAGPRDPRLRKVWLQNNRPYSVRLPQEDGTVRWVSYARYEPMAQLIAIMADWNEILTNEYEEYNGAEGFDKAAGAILIATMENSVNKTFTQGIHDFMTIIVGGEPHKTERALANMVGSFVPNVVNQMNGDEAYREARTILDTIQSRGPNYDRVDVKRNVLGEVLLRPVAKVDPLTMTRRDIMTEDKVFAEIERVAIKVQTVAGHPNKKLGETDLTTIEYKEGQSIYDRWLELTGTVKIGGRTLRKELERTMASPEYQRAPDGTEAYTRGTKAAILSKIISSYRKVAKSELPELAEIERKHLQGEKQYHSQSRRKFLQTPTEIEAGLLKPKARPKSLSEIFNK